MSRNDMRESASVGAIVGTWVAVLMLVIAIALGAITLMARTGKFLQDSIFAPKEEQLRRDVFEQSKAYRDGVVQELRSMQFQYQLADSEHRAGLASMIRHKAAGVPADAIPADLQQFITTLP